MGKHRERDILRVLDGLGIPRILIVGDLILDRYVTGDVSRISPEAPIPILSARTSDERLGGAGNVAANLRAMEAEVEILGVVGDDPLGQNLLGLLEKIGVESSGCVCDADRPTTEKTRLVSGVQQVLRVDWEEVRPIPSPVAEKLLAGIGERIAAAGAVVLSDYGKGVLAPNVIAEVIRVARDAGVPVLVDPTGADYARYRGATLVTPNQKEAELALGRRIENLDDMPAAARDLIAIASLEAAVITLGAQGMYHLAADGTSGGRVPTVARAVYDVTGAGDTVIAHLALGLAAGVGLEAAVQLANQAAGAVVGRRGAASVTRSELRASLGEGMAASGKILERGVDLEGALLSWRGEGKRIAFTNGCFDILHAGHIDYLRFARSKADVLLVAVNDDASVRRLKGEGRPVNEVEDRLRVLAALEMVDAVVAFGEDTPKEIVEEVTPDVLVKGEDWAEKGVVGAEWVERHGGEVHLAPLTPGRSTSAILERARESEARRTPS
ncbi:MAG: D-glycero-beta-D-manno-heptose-7-phosphate kinase [Planctomycetota bacterium]|nr:D-glycero-beta-D-manno-heptose-7-phosphate kinase [Planctomycetota bacterium]